MIPLRVRFKGDIVMCAMLANARPKYTDNEISFMFHQKRRLNNDSIKDIATKFNVDEIIIGYMDNSRGKLTMKMMDIASEYLNIEYNELTEIIEDDLMDISFRGNGDEEAESLVDILNVLFNQMIMQKKLSI